MKKETKVRVPCAYTTERVAQIREAIRAWYKSLPAPRNLIAAKRIEATPRTVSIYVSAKERSQCGPSPKIMAKLFQETGNSVFQMLDSEKEIFRRRGFEVPEAGGVSEKEKRKKAIDAFKMGLGLKRPDEIVGPMSGDKVACPIETKSDEPPARCPVAFSSLTQKLLMAMSVNLSVIGDLLSNVQNGSLAEVKSKAVELVRKTVQVFGLTPDDFQPRQLDAEPGVGDRMSRILNTVFGKQE